MGLNTGILVRYGSLKFSFPDEERKVTVHVLKVNSFIFIYIYIYIIYRSNIGGGAARGIT